MTGNWIDATKLANSVENEFRCTEQQWCESLEIQMVLAELD